MSRRLTEEERSQAYKDCFYGDDDRLISQEEAELRWMPNTETEVDKSKALQNLRIHELLEELDDVQSVASNLAVTDEVLSAYEAS